MAQTLLVDGEVITPKEKQDRKDKEEYPIEYCKNEIIKDCSLWDMRCWDKYHDRDEVIKVLNKFIISSGRKWSIINCGHTEFCLRLLFKQHKVSVEKVADWFLLNNQIQFKNRLVKCWSSSKLCPKFRKQGDFGNNICKKCE
tara:strand:- start:376 stop:801 length:426 start_codon:yes stop_codon:yes gene_type:complete